MPVIPRLRHDPKFGVTAQVPPELASEHTHQRAQVPQRIGK